jgi:TRAP-type mannitol/chloroaromatic compound transport system substrate-binding protein
MDTLRALLHPVSRAVMETCLKASNEADVETSASNADVKKICDSQMAFRDDGNL